ncbi:MAG: DUF447 family protein [Armatimonadota bacterium]|nr:DUF447 family protein [Armatimonadota bacterium]
MPFILETVVSTMGLNGEIRFAPMGVEWTPPILIVRPYRDTATCRNLHARRQGVVNITDNVLTFARTALSREPVPWVRATSVSGGILADACAAYEVEVVEVLPSEPRETFRCRIVCSRQYRPFLGFNRARHAVIEATIAATRLPWLPPAQVRAELDRCGALVDKTGGEQEREALALIRRHVESRLDAHQGPGDG